MRHCVAAEASFVHQDKVPGYNLRDVVTGNTGLGTLCTWKQEVATSVQYDCYLPVLFPPSSPDLCGPRNNSGHYKT